MLHAKKLILPAALAVLLLLPMAQSSAQVVYGQPAAAGTCIIYSHWDIADSVDVSQLMVPLNAFVPLRDNTELCLSAVGTTNSLDVLDQDFSLNGLGDLRLQLNQALSDDRILLSLGINLPTGKKELTVAEEGAVLHVLSYNFLDFPVRHLGEGFGFNLMAGGATMMGAARLGGALTYQFNGSYQPYEKEDYNPGDQFGVIVSADLSNENSAFMASAIYSVFTADQAEDRKIFAQAPSLNLHFGALIGSGPYRYGADLGLLFRGRNARYDSTEAKIEQLKAYGNEYLLAGRFIWSPDQRWQLTPSLEYRFVGENEYDQESGHLIGFGTELSRRLGQSLDLGAGLKYFTGSAAGGDLDLSGYQGTISLTTNFE